MKTVLIIILILFNSFRPLSAQKNNELIKPERVYLQTDRNQYMAGDHLFYSLYLQGNPTHISKYAYLVLRDRNNFDFAQVRVELKNQKAFGDIYISDTLRTDIYQLICFTNFMRNEGEDVFFKKEIIIANRFDEKMDLHNGQAKAASYDSTGRPSGIMFTNDNITIHLNKQKFDQREKVSFSLESNKITKDSLIHISVSISEMLPGIPIDQSIVEYFGVESKSLISAETNPNHFSFIQEINGPVLQGRVLALTQEAKDRESITINEGNAIKNNTVLVSTEDSIVNMQFTITDSLGSFNFHLNPYYDGKELIVRLKEKTNSTIQIDDKLNLIQKYTPSALFNVAGIKDYLTRSAKIVQVQKFYREPAAIITEKEFLHSKTIPRVYTKQNSVIYPSDFLELKDFIEISREILPGLKVRKNDNEFVSRYITIQDQTQINSEPAIFLDGVPIDDVNQIIKLGTNEIKRIETLPVTRYYGEMSFSGILAVFSKNHEIKNIQFKTPTLMYQTLSSQSYTKPIPFNPVNNAKHIPDLRQLLLWVPELILKKNEQLQIECYTSDLQGQYLINIQGLTSGGVPVNGHAIINVK